MTTPPKVVKLGASQVRKPPWMKNQAQDIEDVIKSSAVERKNNEPITEDKKVEKKNDEKKSLPRKKVKMRKRRQREKEDALSDQLREEQEIAEEKKQQFKDQRWREYLERFAEPEKEKEQQIQ